MELLVSRGLREMGLASGTHGGAGTSEANSAGVTHLGKGKVPLPNPS